MKVTAAIKNDHTKFVNQKCTQQVRVTRLHSKLLANYSADVHACVPRQATQPTPWVTYQWARTHSAGTGKPTHISSTLPLSTRSKGHHALLIGLGMSEMNVQLYTINKQTCNLFEGV